MIDVCRQIAEKIDGAYSLVFLDALGDMLVARDPLGIKPLSYAIEGPLFAAASESVALLNLGFAPENIKSLLPGQAVTITRRAAGDPAVRPQPPPGPLLLRVDLLLQRRQQDRRPRVYMTRKALGEELARLETVPIDEDTIVVPVPDTSKAAADAMAYQPGRPLPGRADPQPLQRPHVHRGRQQPRRKGPHQVHAACATCWRASGCSWSRTRSSAARR